MTSDFRGKPGSKRAVRPFWCLLLMWLLSPLAAANSQLPTLGETAAINIDRETELGRSVYERLLSAGFIETEQQD